MENLEQQFSALQADLKAYFEKAKEQEKSAGAVAAETAGKIDAIQKQLDALEVKMSRPTSTGQKTFADELKENESLQRLARDGRGTAVIHLKGGIRELEQKTLITSAAVGSATSGVLLFERMPGVDLGPQKTMFVRNLLPSAPTEANAIDYVKVNAFTSAASPQVEGNDKAESALTFTTATASVRTVAHWIPATKQILADMPGLEEIIRTELLYGLKDKEEEEILTGDNTGEHLNGLITQATAFNTALLHASDGWEKADILARAMQQIAVANQYGCDWFVVNTADWYDIVLTKDTTGRYIAGDPFTAMQNPYLWGKRVVPTNNITSGTFLAGNSRGATIRDRQGATIEISTEHSDYFIKNKVAIRCEERLALVVRRPASYITGTLNTSPA